MEWDRNSWEEGDPEVDATDEEIAEGIDIGALVEANLAEHPDRAAGVARFLADAEADDLTARTLAALRQTLGVTQVELARRLGVKQPTISELERGRYGTMRVTTLLGYLDALGLAPRIVVDVPGSGPVDVTALVMSPAA